MRRAFLILFLTLTTSASAQTTLAWKLKEGETLAVEMTQQTESRVGFSSKNAATKIDLHLRLSWQVQEASANAIQVKQTIDNVRASLSGTGGSAEYDSANKTRVTGLAKQLADSMQPLVGAEFEVVFTPQGEVKSAKPLNEVAQSLLASENKPSESAVTPLSTFTQLVSQSIVPLPEKVVAIGDKWTASRTLQSAPGPLQHETSYALEELLEQDGKQIARINTAGRLLEEPKHNQKSASSLRIKAHEQAGSVLFSIDSGRPTLVEQSQKLQTERTYRDTTIEVSLDSTLKMTFAAAVAMN